MTRRIVEVAAPAEGRDRGQRFVITEMPALQAERWAIRVVMAMLKAGVELPVDAADAGMEALSTWGLIALSTVDFFIIEPLLDEMMGCIQIREKAVIRALVASDIEDVETRLLLRWEVWRLHTAFFPSVFRWIPTRPKSAPGSRATRTSRRP